MAAPFRRRSERSVPAPDSRDSESLAADSPASERPAPESPHSGSPALDSMVCLRTMRDAFGARVIAARLGADGIVTELRGVLGGPYPIGCVSIWVRRDEAEIASDLLLADEVESAFDRDGDAGDEWDGDEWDAGEDWDRPSPRPIIFGWTARRVAALLAVLIILATVAGRLIGA